MTCGHSLFEVGLKPPLIPEETQETPKKTKTIGLKIPVVIGTFVLVLAIVGVAVSQGFIDNVLEKNASNNSVNDKVPENTVEKKTLSDKTNSKCGAGTVFDPNTNSCILG